MVLGNVQPMGDQAVLATFPHERAALRWADTLRRQRAHWVIDIVSAYTTVAVYFDPERTTYSQAVAQLPGLDPPVDTDTPLGRLHEIPCCYAMQLDLQRVAAHTALAPQSVIALHTSTTYTVYALGFCPGFPYLGYLPEALGGVPRLATPRLRITPGSVALTGRQTGIYPLERPGGWNVIGRTPLQLVDVEAGYFPLRPGDQVRFVAIDEEQFHRLAGQRL